MKAVILAAGKGKRLADYTQERPKPMVDVGGKPCLERIISAIHAAGVQEFVIVTGYLSQVIEDYFGDGSSFGLKISYVTQKVQDGTGSAVHLTRSEIGDSSFMMTYGDVLMPKRNYRGMVEAFQDKPCTTLMGVNWVEDPYRGAAVYIGDDNEVERIEEKPPQGTATTHWNNAGTYIFDSVVFNYTAKLQPSPRGEYELPDAIQGMKQDGLSIYAYRLEGDWKDIGTPQDLKSADSIVWDK